MNVVRTWTILAAALAFTMLSGCAAGLYQTYGIGTRFDPKTHPGFTQDRISQVEIGLSVEDIVDLFGHPDARKIDNSGGWTAMLYEYKFLDREWASISVTKSNYFWFDMAHDPPLLNSYQIDIQHKGTNDEVYIGSPYDWRKANAEIEATNADLTRRFCVAVEEIVELYDVSYTAAVMFVGWRAIHLGMIENNPDAISDLLNDSINDEIRSEDRRGTVYNRPAIISAKRFNIEIEAIVAKHNVRYQVAVELLCHKYNLGIKATVVLMNDHVRLRFANDK